MYIQRVTFHPAPGKTPELRTLLAERVKASQAQAIQAGLAEQLFGAEGQAFVITVRHRDLAALEQARRRNQDDPAFQAFLAQVNQLIRAPVRQQLLEVLVPLPS